MSLDNTFILKELKKEEAYLTKHLSYYNGYGWLWNKCGCHSEDYHTIEDLNNIKNEIKKLEETINQENQ